MWNNDESTVFRSCTTVIVALWWLDEEIIVTAFNSAKHFPVEPIHKGLTSEFEIMEKNNRNQVIIEMTCEMPIYLLIMFLERFIFQRILSYTYSQTQGINSPNYKMSHLFMTNSVQSIVYVFKDDGDVKRFKWTQIK